MDNIVDVNTVDATVQSQEQTPQQVQTNTEPTPATTPLTEIEIDGIGKVKVDELKEWKQGYLRQQDYTKKTQAVAREKAEIKDALDVYNYLKNNPAIAQQLASGQVPQNIDGTPLATMNPVTKQVADVQRELALMKLDNDLANLKTKYSDFDEVATLTKAEELGVADLEFVWNAIRGANVDNLKTEIEKQVRTTLTEQIKKNGLDTKTIINTNDTVNKSTINLSQEEMLIAQKMGIDPKMYAENKF